MKNSRLAPSLMGIFFNICSFLILALPVWYFSDAHVLKETGEEITNEKQILIRIFEHNKIDNIATIYKSYDNILELNMLNVFNTSIIISLCLSVFLIAILITAVVKNVPNNGKLLGFAKFISIVILAFTITSLVLALIFTSNSEVTLIDNHNEIQTLSMNLSSGIYLFVIFNMASAFCGLVSPNLDDYPY